MGYCFRHAYETTASWKDHDDTQYIHMHVHVFFSEGLEKMKEAVMLSGAIAQQPCRQHLYQLWGRCFAPLSMTNFRTKI